MSRLRDVIGRGLLSARPAAGTAGLIVGQLYYATDTQTYYQYDGSAWQTNTIAGGMPNPMTTQDDLIIAGASGTPARLAKGTDGQVLTVDPATHHLVWADPAGGGGGSASGARVYASAAQSIPNNAWTALAFDSERRDDNGYHDPVTNNTRLTAVTAGWYSLWANMALYNTTGIRGVRLYLNGTTPIATQVTANANGSSTVVVSTFYYLNANDYVEAQAYQNSGGAVSTTVEANDTTEAAIIKLP